MAVHVGNKEANEKTVMNRSRSPKAYMPSEPRLAGVIA
jgi:hypothetical protein